LVYLGPLVDNLLISQYNAPFVSIMGTLYAQLTRIKRTEYDDFSRTFQA